MDRPARVYLSGGMEYARDQGRLWRRELEAWLEGELGWEVYNPNTESERLIRTRFGGADLRALKARDPDLFRTIARDLVDQDCREIALRSACVVCLWDEAAAQGAGTKGELTIARYFGKPVYLVSSLPPAGIPGWVLGCTDRIFSDFGALRSFLGSAARLPGPTGRTDPAP
ncbi:MAG: hypothetical protein WB626_10595 [Bacteroidota bacterium]